MTALTKADKLNNAVLALQEKLNAAIEARDNHAADQAAEAARLNIAEGTEVGFTFGRGDTKQELRGKVIATVDTDNGRLLKVLAGEGAGLKVYDVRAKDAVLDTAENAGTVQPVDSQPESDAVAAGATGADLDAAQAEHDAAADAVAQL